MLHLYTNVCLSVCSALLNPFVPKFIMDWVTKYKLLLVAETSDKKKGTVVVSHCCQ